MLIDISITNSGSDGSSNSGSDNSGDGSSSSGGGSNNSGGDSSSGVMFETRPIENSPWTVI